MFEREKMLGDTGESVCVETRKGTRIPNSIELTPGLREQRIWQLLCTKYGSQWKERKPPCGVYNCAGHVWASRRTSIFDQEHWDVILKEDGYRRLQSGESPQEGDLVLYEDEGGTYFHVGRIVSFMAGITDDSRPIPVLISKLNSTAGEIKHRIDDLPFVRDGLARERSVWTDRPLLGAR